MNIYNPILEIKSVSKVYNFNKYNIFGKSKQNIIAINNISMKIIKGESIGVLGESGSGKTTLGRIIIGLEKPTSGEVVYNGLNKKREIQMIFQDSFGTLDPRMSIYRTLEEPLRIHAPNISKAEKKYRIIEVLEDVEISKDSIYKYPHEFSGGQRQRINIARALILKPSIIICDEPTSSLDMSIQAQILNLFKLIQKEYNMTYIFISHDIGVIRFISDKVIVIKDGSVIEKGFTNEVIDFPKHTYTKQLMNSIPIGNPRIARNRRNKNNQR